MYGKHAPQKTKEREVKREGTYKAERHNRSTIIARPRARPLPGPRGDALILIACGGHTKKRGAERWACVVVMCAVMKK
jgi:hypothetical protein